MKNSIFTIHPYADDSGLYFDDPAVDLVREAFIGGADTILMSVAKAAGANPTKFTLLFSATPFPGHQVVAKWAGSDEFGSGNWYNVEMPDSQTMKGWLCPAILLYFPKPPPRIFFQIRPFKRNEP